VDLLLEIVALRQQLEGYRRQVRRPRLRRADRLFWIWLCRHWTRWRSALVIVQPEAVLRWHREGFRRHWRRISRGRPGRPRTTNSIVRLIEQMSRQNPTWGEDRIALELKLKLGEVLEYPQEAASVSRGVQCQTRRKNLGTAWVWARLTPPVGDDYIPERTFGREIPIAREGDMDPTRGRTLDDPRR
jgi:hypothetical protein